ncbi:MAG TPA: discoidin domain-containing protein, partial [Thermomicrobiales bacterium]|nr:discoidin domain-containing protein [Thermomicrobiales bacterium]
ASDNEQSGTADLAVDGNPSTMWMVTSSPSQQTVELVVDLGQLQPVGGVSWWLGTTGTMPAYQVWLSDDGQTWHLQSSFEGSVQHPQLWWGDGVGFWARYVKFLVPHADQSGLQQIGGISEIQIWRTPDGNAMSLQYYVTPVAGP